MKLQDLHESMVVAEFYFRDVLTRELNDVIVHNDLSIDKFEEKDKRITQDMVNWFGKEHEKLEDKFEYDPETDSLGKGSEQEFQDARFDLAQKVMASIIGPE